MSLSLTRMLTRTFGRHCRPHRPLLATATGSSNSNGATASPTPGTGSIKKVAARGMAWTPASAAFPRRTAAELYAEILDLTKEGGDYTVHNYGQSMTLKKGGGSWLGIR